jgi:hypothetical protein
VVDLYLNRSVRTAQLRVVPPAKAYGEAKAAALRALAMDDTCVGAQLALGAVSFWSE